MKTRIQLCLRLYLTGNVNKNSIMFETLYFLYRVHSGSAKRIGFTVNLLRMCVTMCFALPASENAEICSFILNQPNPSILKTHFLIFP
jgi:hypothetical protein